MAVMTRASCPLDGEGKEAERDQGTLPRSHNQRSCPGAQLPRPRALGLHFMASSLTLTSITTVVTPSPGLIVSPTGTHLSPGASHTSSSTLNFNSQKGPCWLYKSESPRGLSSPWPPPPGESRAGLGRPSLLSTAAQGLREATDVEPAFPRLLAHWPPPGPSLLSTFPRSWQWAQWGPRGDP